jgi:methionyl-tRNA formyltransferase
MKATFLCPKGSWVEPLVKAFLKKDLPVQSSLINDHKSLKDDPERILFILSYPEIISQNDLDLSALNIVAHASDLPKGRGMSPLTWQVLEGENRIPLTLFRCVKGLDEGDIVSQGFLELDGSELITEMREKMMSRFFEMIHSLLEKYPEIKFRQQSGEASYYSKRTARDSELDLKKSLEENFNLLRVVDNENYPAFFVYKNKKYIVKIYEDSHENN